MRRTPDSPTRGPYAFINASCHNGRVDGLVVHQLLHLVLDCLAPLGIQFGRLLLEEVVDLRVAAIGIGTALDDEGGETGRGVAEGTARALDDILEPLVAVRLEKSRSFERAHLGAHARRPWIVDHCLAAVLPRRIA